MGVSLVTEDPDIYKDKTQLAAHIETTETLW